MLAPDDVYTKFNLSLERARENLTAAQANLTSPDQGLRQQAEQTLKAFGEMARAVTNTRPDSPPPAAPANDASEEQRGLWFLACLVPQISKDASNNADKARQKLANAALNALDSLAGQIAKAQKQPGRIA